MVRTALAAIAYFDSGIGAMAPAYGIVTLAVVPAVVGMKVFAGFTAQSAYGGFFVYHTITSKI